MQTLVCRVQTFENMGINRHQAKMGCSGLWEVCLAEDLPMTCQPMEQVLWAPMNFNMASFIQVVVDESTVTWHCCCHALAKTHDVVCEQPGLAMIRHVTVAVRKCSKCQEELRKIFDKNSSNLVLRYKKFLIPLRILISF